MKPRRRASAQMQMGLSPAVVVLSVSFAGLLPLGCASPDVSNGGWLGAPSATHGAMMDAGASNGPAPATPTPGATPAVDASIGNDAGIGAGAADASSPAPFACAGTPSLQPGADQTLTLDQGGQARTYLIHVGTSVATESAAPLVVNVHGLNNSPAIQVAFSGMNPVADAKGFVVVYPQGLNASFNAGGCCGASQSANVDDVGFIRAIVADVQSKLCIDPRRIYATGFSNGGYMAHRLGCEASDLFAAIAPVEGANASPTCSPPRPVPVVAFHGNADPVVTYASASASVDDWVARDTCSGAPVRTAFGTSYCDEWSSCAGGVKVKFCTIAGGTHLWPGAGAPIEATPVIWDFFTEFAMP